MFFPKTKIPCSGICTVFSTWWRKQCRLRKVVYVLEMYVQLMDSINALHSSRHHGAIRKTTLLTLRGCCCCCVSSVMSNSVQPHRQQPTRLPHPWDSPGKNSGVGCHFLLQCLKVKSESEVAQSCPTPSDPMECSLPGSSIHGICQARVLEWGAIASSTLRGYNQLKR